MWLSPNPTATTTLVSTHVNHRSLSTAASLCPSCPQMFLHCVSCGTELSQISGVYAYTAVDTAHIGMQVQILSVWSQHLEWLEMHQRREACMVMNRSALPHHPLRAFSVITTRKSRTPSTKAEKNVLNIHRCRHGYQRAKGANKEIRSDWRSRQP